MRSRHRQQGRLLGLELSTQTDSSQWCVLPDVQVRSTQHKAAHSPAPAWLLRTMACVHLLCKHRMHLRLASYCACLDMLLLLRPSPAFFVTNIQDMTEYVDPNDPNGQAYHIRTARHDPRTHIANNIQWTVGSKLSPDYLTTVAGPVCFNTSQSAEGQAMLYHKSAYYM